MTNTDPKQSSNLGVALAERSKPANLCNMFVTDCAVRVRGSSIDRAATNSAALRLHVAHIINECWVAIGLDESYEEFTTGDVPVPERFKAEADAHFAAKRAAIDSAVGADAGREAR